MDPLSLVALVAGSAQNFMNIGGGLFSSALQYKYNKKLQDRAFEHQIRMFQNQHQWEVDDLRKAGLNPILSTHAGSSMPSSASSSVSAPDLSFNNFADSLVKAQGFSSARDLQKFARENHEVELASKEADLARKDAEADFIRAQRDNLEATTARTMFDLNFLQDENYNELRILEQLHKVFPVDGDIGFNLTRGKFGKGFGANLNLGDTFSAFGRSMFYKALSKAKERAIIEIGKKPPKGRSSTNYKYKYYNKQ